MNQKTNEPICHILQECHSKSLFLTSTGTGKLLHVNRLTEMSKQECGVKDFLHNVWLGLEFMRQLGEVWASGFKQDVLDLKEVKRNVK